MKKSIIMKFRKKPVVIEAVQLTETNADDTAFWCGGKVIRLAKPSDPSDVNVILHIPTLEGVMAGNIGDWIIKGVQGEFYPCKPDIFEATYEAVNES